MRARLRDIQRAIEARGGSVEPNSSGGSHYKARFAGKMYPIPAHNGGRSEIGEEYIRGLCRAFGWDLETFKRELRGERPKATTQPAVQQFAPPPDDPTPSDDPSDDG